MHAREIGAFIAWKSTRQNTASSSLGQYKSELARFQRFLNREEEPSHIWDATEIDISRFLHETGQGSAQTRSTRSIPIRQYFKYLVDVGVRPDDPAANLQLAKAPRKSTPQSVLPREDIKKLLNAPTEYVGGRDLRARDKAILYALYSGLKRAECRSLLLRDVDLEKRRVKVSGRKVHVKLTEEAATAFKEYADVRPQKISSAFFPSKKSKDGHLGSRQINQIVDKYVYYCNLSVRATAETLRTTFAVHAVEDRIGFVDLMDALGTNDRIGMQRLLDLARPRMAAAAIGLPPSCVYPANSGYAFYVDVAAEIGKAKATAFIVDAYLNEEFFKLYVSKVPPGVKLRILTNGTRASKFTALDPNVEAIAKLFAASHALELRISTQLHDRHIFIDGRGWVVGQSIKDAARKKPTYVIELPDPTLQELRDIHDTIWKSGIVAI